METRRDLKQRLRDAEQLAAARLETLDEIERSSSWRLTAPLRSARRRLAGDRDREAAPSPPPPPRTIPPGGFTPTAHESHELWRQPWRSSADPPDRVNRIPAMITDDERRLLHWLGRDYYSGAGKIVDGGCYLGGSTAALASGVAARSSAAQAPPITSYDRFIVDYFMRADIPDDADLDEGESFRALFERNLAEYEHLIEVREGDITEIGWSGEPIEIAFLDVLKSWPINDFVLANFFGSMIPGRTIIVQQDFVYEYGPWIHVTMGMLDPYVELLDLLEWGSAVYLLREPIPAGVLGTRTRTDLTPAELVTYMNRAIEPATGEVRGTLEVAKAALLRLVEGFAAMEDHLDRVETEYPGSWRVARSIESVYGWGVETGYGRLKLRGKRDVVVTDPPH